jgi:hypothetical protein
MKKYIIPAIKVIELNTETALLLQTSTLPVDADQDATQVRTPRRRSVWNE